jgi:hypothetical protein
MRRAVLLVVLAALFAGCGHKEDYILEGHTEGVYLDVGDLVYQVQLSRYLNPADPEDAQYLTGLPEGIEPELPGDEVWFGIWMKVWNYTEDELRPTTTFRIEDTEGNVFEPVPLSDNVFTYEAEPLPPEDGILPPHDTAAASGPIQGALLLFRLPVDTLQNRPLVFHIEQGGSQPAEVELDL